MTQVLNLFAHLTKINLMCLGIDHGAEQAPFYKFLSDTIKSGCKIAIAISKTV